ncbi:hypothetical protein ABZP36_014180 [Zizania latifolia]
MMTGLSKGGGWTVKPLRVRFPRHLDYSWEKLHDGYRKLELFEVCECANVQAWPASASHGELWSKVDKADCLVTPRAVDVFYEPLN